MGCTGTLVVSVHHGRLHVGPDPTVLFRSRWRLVTRLSLLWDFGVNLTYCLPQHSSHRHHKPLKRTGNIAAAITNPTLGAVS